MRFGIYVLMVFCMSVVAWWMGMTSPFQETFAKQAGGDWMSFDNVIKAIVGAMTVNGDVIITAVLGLALAAFASTLLQGFSATFLVPMLILIAVAEFFIMPLSFLFDNSLPAEIRLPLIFLLNMFMVLAVVDFVRGKT